MKFCGICNEDKPYEDFNKANRKYGDGYNSYCRKCQSLYYFARKELRQKNQVYLESKECSTCKNIKPISEFGKLSTSDDGYNDHCSKCWRRRILKAL
jgi:adenine-specific DNA methylase